MTLLFLPIGFLLPTLSGERLLRLLEGKTPVLFRAERWVLGFILGITLTMYMTFLAHVLGVIDFTLMGFVFVQAICFAITEGCFLRMRKTIAAQPNPPLNILADLRSLPRWIQGVFAILSLWTLVKIITGATLLVTSPVYFDDVFNNWNFRGKVFFETEHLSVGRDIGSEVLAAGGVHSYPPTVPMVKTMLSTFLGYWDEGLINAPHIFWYVALIALLFFSLRRYLNLPFALLGAYLYASMPLPLMHGSNAYADIFLSVHLFAALSLLVAAFSETHLEKRSAFFRIAALAMGLLVFTKNEALVLHLPPLILLLALALCFSWYRGTVSSREVLRTMFPFAIAIGAVAVPWVTYKLFYGLAFGNAKALPDFEWTLNFEALYAMWYTTLFEANWIFFFPLLVGLIIARFRSLLRSPLLLPATFLFIVIAAQMSAFLFTGLSTEAVRQTGFPRGMLQLLPIGVLLATSLLKDLLAPRGDRPPVDLYS